MRIKAMNILAAREHSVSELRQKLRTKWLKKTVTEYSYKGSRAESEAEAQESEHDPEQIEDLIEQLLQQLVGENLLNDERFTEVFIRSRMSRGQGPVKIRHELQQRQVATELVDQYLDESWDIWQDTLETVRRKKFGADLPVDYKEQAKQSRFLYQRGFGSELIRRLFNEL